MRVHAISILCTLTWAVSAVKEYSPRVSKSIVEGSHDCDFSLPVRLGDSDTLILNFENRLNISFDNGESWQTVDTIENVERVTIDQFHQERAFVLTRSRKSCDMYVTEDQGKNWKKLSLPKYSGKLEMRYFPITHPFNKKLLLLHCEVINFNDVNFIEPRTINKSRSFSFKGRVIYGSDDGGENFKRIASSPYPDDSLDRITTCKFAASSNESTFDRDGIYCIEMAERQNNTQVQSSNETKISSRERLFQQEDKSVIGTLFYTTDLGKTEKTFEELNGLSVERIFVLPSGIAVLTSEAHNNSPVFEYPTKSWILTAESFIPALLPEEVTSLQRPIKILSDDSRGQILWIANVENDSDSRGSLLVSDFYGQNFSFWGHPAQLFDTTSPFPVLEQIGNLKGTLWGKFMTFKSYKGFEKTNWLQRFLSFLRQNIFCRSCQKRQKMPRRQRVTVTKGSFDNGRTWDNLKVLDISGKHKHLFKCDIDNTEHCSFQEVEYYSHSLGESEPTAGIIMRVGTVGEAYRGFGTDDLTSFISRDGGASWELAFEFPATAAFLDFGNIIVVLPDESEELEEEVYTKFLFSLDQGRTWEEHHFDEPIPYPEDVILDGRGLKATVGFIRRLEDSKEYVSYLMDFSNAFDGTACTAKDWETWHLSNGNCIDGMKHSFERRKPDAKCLMRKTFETLELHKEICGT